MYERYIKRLLDIFLGFLTLPILIICILIFGLLIKLEDGGPILYKSRRIGKGGRIFTMYKFRSMKVNAPMLLNADGSTYNSKNDPRVTRVGKFIRETSIDELPLIINVLKGDMSVIGPRQSLESALSTFRADEIDKMKVRPGISGYTQAYFRNDLPNRDKRLKDAWYANNVSFILDMKIMGKTILTVVRRKGLYTNPSGIPSKTEGRDKIHV